MDALHGAGEGNRVIVFSTDHFRGCEANNRPQPFPAGENTVAHRLVDRFRLGGGGGEETIQRRIDFFLARGPVMGEIHPRSYANAVPFWQTLSIGPTQIALSTRPQMLLLSLRRIRNFAVSWACFRLFLAVSVLVTHLRYGRGILGVSFLDGGLAVQCFFIISGFYMALVLNEKYNYKGSYGTFILQRFLRLYPVYIVVTILILVIEGAVSYFTSHPYGIYQVWTRDPHFITPLTGCYYVLTNLLILGQDVLWFFYQDSATGQLYPTPYVVPHATHCIYYLVNMPTWTLSVEMTFYLLAPFLGAQVRAGPGRIYAGESRPAIDFLLDAGSNGRPRRGLITSRRLLYFSLWRDHSGTISTSCIAPEWRPSPSSTSGPSGALPS